MRRLCALLLLGLSVTLLASADSRVGFRRLTITDRSRPGADSGWRTIHAFLWYPAREGGVAMTRAEYFAADAAEGIAVGRDELRRRVQSMLDVSPSDEQLDEVLLATLDVRRDAEPRTGTFPVVLVSAGLRSPPHTMSSICERMAAAGYFVAAVPTPPLANGARLGFDQIALETVMRDLESTLGTLSLRDDVDVSRVALVGWSVGSVAQALLQMRNPLFDGLVSLDGGIGYDYGSALARESIWFRSGPLSAPLLDIRALGTEGVPRAFDVLDLPRSARSWRLESDSLTHAELTTTFGELAPQVTATSSMNQDVLELITRATILFLDSVLRDDEKSVLALDALTTKSNNDVRFSRIDPSNQ